MEYDVKFVPRTYLISSPPTNASASITKAAPIALWNTALSEWTKKFLVLRRPYLYLYSSATELEEEVAIPLSTLRLDHGEKVTEMLGVSPPRRKGGLTKVDHVFAIYTSFNSFLIQTRSLEDCQDWIWKIDRNYNYSLEGKKATGNNRD
jgi:kinesin family member 1